MMLKKISHASLVSYLVTHLRVLTIAAAAYKKNDAIKTTSAPQKRGIS